jgi:hypothetical protein
VKQPIKTKENRPVLKTFKELLRQTPKVILSPNEHEVNLLPTKIRVHFIDAVFMESFEPFAESNFRNIKFINFGKAAINLTFTEKHKYHVQREPEPEEIFNHLQNRLDALRADFLQTELFEDAGIRLHKEKQRAEMVELQTILDEIHDYQFAISNYHRRYTYWYVNWRWQKDDKTLDYGQEHLLKDETDSKTRITTEKENIIFVDMSRIGEHTPYQSKKVEEFLNSFDRSFESGTLDIFVKPKEF